MTIREALHFIRKLQSTLRMLYCLGMARTFGRYIVTLTDEESSYAIYEWGNKRWSFPTRAMEDGGHS